MERRSRAGNAGPNTGVEMTDRHGARPPFRPHWTRREWLGGVALLAFGAAGAGRPEDLSPAETKLVEIVRARTAEAGIKNAGVDVSDHFVGVGDAPSAFRIKALKLCESLAATFLQHFKAKGFEVTLPRDRMVVVTLADRESYAAFKGEDVDDSEGGHFDVAGNRLAVFDFLNGRGKAVGNVRTMNTFTLVHESIHQLTFNTGLLDPQGDVPDAVSEGLATYGELWQLGKPQIGQKNGLRLAQLKNPSSDDAGWIPVVELLTDDKLFSDGKTEQRAYAEAWLLVYDLMQTKAGAKKLQNYLRALHSRRDTGHRIAVAEEALGDLEKLDNGLKKRVRTLR